MMQLTFQKTVCLMKEKLLRFLWLRPVITFLPSLEKQYRCSKIEVARAISGFCTFCLGAATLRRFKLYAKRLFLTFSHFVTFYSKPLTSKLSSVEMQLRTVKLSLRSSLKMLKMKVYQIIESEEFSLTATRIGDPEEVDVVLQELCIRLSYQPKSFPIAAWPNERMALRQIGKSSVGIFFRIIHNSRQVELLRSVIKN
jgi:hypothetical protein